MSRGEGGEGSLDLALLIMVTLSKTRPSFGRGLGEGGVPVGRVGRRCKGQQGVGAGAEKDRALSPLALPAPAPQV